MNRWRLSKSWVLVWGFTIGLAGLILLIGYRSSVPEISLEGLQGATKDSAYIASTCITLPTDFCGVTKPLDLKCFPSPVEGKPIRNIGIYYAEVMDRYVFHTGEDFALSEGTVIRATCGGKVVFAGSDDCLGQKVILDCGEGWLVTYGGLDNLRVQEGEVVETQGALGQIGYFKGAERESDQSHLHYEIWHGDEIQSFS